MAHIRGRPRSNGGLPQADNDDGWAVSILNSILNSNELKERLLSLLS